MGPKIASSLLVAGLAVALYANSIPGDFVFDDHEAIENNLDVRSGVQHILCMHRVSRNVVSALRKWSLRSSLLSEQLCMFFSCAITIIIICSQIMIHWFCFFLSSHG